MPPLFRSFCCLSLALAATWMSPDCVASEALVSVVREGTQLVFRAGDRELLRYQAEPGELPRSDIKEAYRRGGYLHPIHTPAGRKVSDDFPANHIHHHGIWMPWTKTRFEDREPDFWNMGGGKGRVEFVAIDQVWEKNERAGFKARHRFADLTAQPSKVALDETWDVVVSTLDDGLRRNVIDFTSTQTCATPQALELPKYHYGGFGFRGSWSWNGPGDACLIMTSEGETNRGKANGTRARWAWIGGKVDGALAGVTILCHPENFRSPQPIRIHPSEPFFCFAPQQLGDMAITPGTPYVSRYRIIVTDGKPAPEQIEAWWKAWAP